MSKGPGKIERAIEAILIAEPDQAFSTTELARKVYAIDQVEKKHRVSILRAARQVSQRHPLDWKRSTQHGDEQIFYQPDSLMSVAVCELKRGYEYGHYEKPEKDLLNSLKKGGENHHLLSRKSDCYVTVQIWKAKQAGDKKLVKKLERQRELKSAADLAALGKMAKELLTGVKNK